MRTGIWRSVYTLAVTACAAVASAPAPLSQSAPAEDVSIPKDRRELLQSVLRDELVRALEPLELKGSESKSDEIRVKNGFPPIDLKIGQIDYKVSASVRFPDVARDLKLTVESLVKHEARTLRGQLSAPPLRRPATLTPSLVRSRRTPISTRRPSSSRSTLKSTG